MTPLTLTLGELKLSCKVKASLNYTTRPSLKNKKVNRQELEIQLLVECSPNVQEALGLVPSAL